MDPELWKPAPRRSSTPARHVRGLREYLKRHGAFKHAGKKQWATIKKWCETSEGVQWLQGAGLDPLSFHLHHIKAKARGGVSSVFNCAFTPGGANASFGDRDDEWMRSYVGKQACSIADAHAVWYIAKSGEGPDQSEFDFTRATLTA